MAFGVTAEGFVKKTQENILQELQDEQRETIGKNLDTSAESPHGQTNATFARQCALVWEATEAAYYANDRDKAADDALIALCKLTGTFAREATYSRVLMTVDLDNGTLLETDVDFVAVDGKPEVRFTPVVDYTAGSDGVFEVMFRAENTGPVFANAGTLTVISKTGWNSATNVKDATPGKPADSNETLRARQQEEVAAPGSATAGAIKAALLRLEDENGELNIQNVLVIENDTDIDGVNGLPRHTLEAVVDDSPAVNDDLIAQTIFDEKAGGIGTAGSESGDAVTSLGGVKTVYFSRPVEKPVFLIYTITYGPGYVGDDQFKTNVVEALSAQHKQGTDVFQWICELAGRQPGVLNLNVTLGFNIADVISNEDDLVVLGREKATFDTGDIAVFSSATEEPL